MAKSTENQDNFLATTVFVLKNGRALQGRVEVSYDKNGNPFPQNFVTVDAIRTKFRFVRAMEFQETETYGYLYVEVLTSSQEKFALMLAKKEIEEYGFKFSG